MYYFPKVALLITHYNRSQSLDNLLTTFRSLGCTFGHIVVSDDGSKQEHLDCLENLQTVYSFTLLRANQNMGLGNNINKGQDSITLPFTLYVQEDFEPTNLFPGSLKDALTFMEGDEDLDIVRFYSYLRYPGLKPAGKGFSEMRYPPFSLNYKKVYYYSDHPHLRRNSFSQKFGRYFESVNSDRTEYKMCVSFIQNKGKGLFYDDYQSLFIQKNTTFEPSTVSRVGWRQSENPLIAIIRNLYRQVKYNYDILFLRSRA